MESTEFSGGGSSHNDTYPNGWHVTARKLKEDGSYNPKGDLIEFYQTGCFCWMVEKPVVVDKMERTFVKSVSRKEAS